MFDAGAYFDSLDMFGIRLGLDATRELMAKAGHPERGLRFIHIAGTNGKGSVGAMLERALREAGLRTGFYTSPHLIDIRERFRIDGKAVSTADFDAAAEELHREAGTGRYSYFEFATVLAMKLFAAAGTDAVIWETGMGGRLDATNVVTPQACVITNIALDHQAHLGGTLAAIAGEKAGIIKPGVPLFHGVLPPEARAVIYARAAEAGAPVHPPLFPVPGSEGMSNGCWKFTYDGRQIELSLPGRMQRENFRIVYHLLTDLSERWHFDLEKALGGLRHVRWPARFQHLGRVIIDGGHNPDGVRALAEAAAESHPGEKFLVVYAAFRDKRAAECLKYLERIADEFLFTEPEAEGRAVYSPGELSAMTEVRSSGEKDPEKALDMALAAAGGRRVLVSGSLYLAGTALRKFASPASVLDL